MSNPLAIAAVTATLRNLIMQGVPDLPNQNVTAKPLDKVRSDGSTPDQLNIFLYQTVVDGAWRNMDIPQQVRSGETGQPPLPLGLYYLITGFGKGDDDTLGHRWLGKAMSILHDHPLLGAQEIKDALSDNSELQNQLERVRITLQPLSIEEMSKLWTAFQTQYRLSAAYQVSVVLIESTRRTTTPLPVLTRGKDDTGPSVQPDLTVPFPTLLDLKLAAAAQASAKLGQQIVLHGHHLNGDSLTARFNNPRLPAPIDILLPGIAAEGETDVPVSLPDTAAARSTWVAGIYTVALLVSRLTDPANKIRTTNQLSFSLAPNILTITPKTSAAAAGDFTLTLTCSPHVLPDQRASLLFGSNEILADAHAAATDTLTFRISPVTPTSQGNYYLRLRVDGVDSLLVNYAQSPPTFDSNQRVTIT